jgi:hypothetical protein
VLSYRSFKLTPKEIFHSALVAARFELLTVTLLEFQLLWDMRLYSWGSSSQNLKGHFLCLKLLNSEDEGSTVLRNIGNYWPTFSITQTTRLEVYTVVILHSTKYCLKYLHPFLRQRTQISRVRLLVRRNYIRYRLISVGPLYRTCCRSPISSLDFEVSHGFLENFWHPSSKNGPD